MLNLNNKTILITGGSGSWGNELTKRILEKYNPKKILIYSRGEMKQWEMKKRFENHPKIKFIIGDIRDFEKIKIASKEVDLVFHLAALKHVPVCEENPNEAVLTNVVGTQNVISASIENSVEAVVFISTDKAVDPLNLYGITKSCAERLIIAANNVTEKTKFICIRGGNVLGTNGSIVPLFKEQIITKEKVTLTDDRMTRFFLNLDDAIKLIFKSLETSVGGETFVMKMPSAKIIDLANVMIEELSDKEIHIEKIGIRPGEKIHELLVSKYDSGRIIEEEEYFIILPLIEIPNLKDYYKNRIFKTEAEYSSDKARRLDMEEIKEMLRKDGWLDKKMEIELGEKKTIDLPKGVEYV